MIMIIIISIIMIMIMIILWKGYFSVNPILRFCNLKLN